MPSPHDDVELAAAHALSGEVVARSIVLVAEGYGGDVGHAVTINVACVHVSLATLVFRVFAIPDVVRVVWKVEVIPLIQLTGEDEVGPAR